MYKSFEPDAELSPFVECYWSWQVEPDDDALDDLLPDAAPELIVHFGSTPLVQSESGEWQHQERAFLYCAAYKTLRLSIQGQMKVFAIRFRPWGLRRFSDIPMARILDRPVSPLESLSELGDGLVKGLCSLGSDSLRVELADELLKNALLSSSRVEPRLKMLLDAADGGRRSSSEMARTLMVSDRSFSRLWNDVVGIQPRKFVQLMRFHKALEMIDGGVALAQVAANCGFSDQAHMARQIKAITGLTPSLLKRRLGNKVYRDLYKSRPAAPWHSA